MSFILDALRKSEHARQKQTGPGLAEVPVVAPRARSNVWATAAIALLVVNLVAVGVLLLRRAHQADDAPPAAVTATSAARPAEVAGAATGGPETSAEVANAATGPTLAPPASAAPPSAAPVRAPADDARNPLAEEVGGTAPNVDPALTAAAASVPRGPPAVTRQPANARQRGSVVYQTIPEAADEPYSAPPAAAPAAAAADALPSADDMTARGGLPALHLDLHVYANQPQQRFVFVNSRKYREGETLQEGPVVEQITPDGAVLSFRGSRFKLSND